MLVVYAGVIAFGMNEFRKTPDRLHSGARWRLSDHRDAAAAGRFARPHRRRQSAGRRAGPRGTRRRSRRQHRRLFGSDAHERSQCRRRVRGAEAVRGARQRSAISRRRRSKGALLAKFSTIQDALVFVVAPPPVRGIGSAGGFRMMIQDRGGAGPAALQQVVGAMMAKAERRRPGVQQVFSLFENVDAAALSRHRPRQSADARHQRDRRVHGAADLSRLGLRQRLQSARAHIPRDGAGRQQLPGEHQGRPQNPRAQFHRRYGAARIVHDRARHFGPVARSALQPLSGGRARRLCGARLFAGPGHRPHAEARGRNAAAGFSYEWTELAYQQITRRQHRGVRLRARRRVRVPRARRAVREFDAAACGHPHRADEPHRLDHRRRHARAWTTTS